MSYDANGSPVDGPHPTTHTPSPSEEWSGVRGMLDGFSVMGTDSFPAHLCVVPDKQDPDLRLSSDNDYHIVVSVDSRFSCNGRIALMRPCTYIDPEAGLEYGWVDKDGNFLSHGERPAYEPDHAKVVAWKPCSHEFDLRR